MHGIPRIPSLLSGPGTLPFGATSALVRIELNCTPDSAEQLTWPPAVSAPLPSSMFAESEMDRGCGCGRHAFCSPPSHRFIPVAEPPPEITPAEKRPGPAAGRRGYPAKDRTVLADRRQQDRCDGKSATDQPECLTLFQPSATDRMDQRFPQIPSLACCHRFGCTRLPGNSGRAWLMV